MVIVETSVFTRQVVGLLSDDEYHKLQVVLANRPNAGAIIQHSGGFREKYAGRSKARVKAAACASSTIGLSSKNDY